MAKSMANLFSCVLLVSVFVFAVTIEVGEGRQCHETLSNYLCERVDLCQSICEHRHGGIETAWQHGSYLRVPNPTQLGRVGLPTRSAVGKVGHGAGWPAERVR
ncbi:uncharacterized protein LOC130947936 [Arachis stenosperma]|uniref:uncharacterized protein LOC130947936 n=1 Tax=Arachis stenosperma TaxID=217475 RepID=UPI0025AD8076|nr:uncharacterized protein LOC130947936 [Arachis stenosperma]